MPNVVYGCALERKRERERVKHMSGVVIGIHAHRRGFAAICRARERERQREIDKTSHIHTYLEISSNDLQTPAESECSVVCCVWMCRREREGLYMCVLYTCERERK